MTGTGTHTDSIRRAISSGEIQKAAELWDLYAAVLEEEIRSGASSRSRLEEVRDLVEWSRITVLCARSHQQDELNSTHAALQYDPAAGDDDPALIRVYS